MITIVGGNQALRVVNFKSSEVSLCRIRRLPRSLSVPVYGLLERRVVTNLNQPFVSTLGSD